MGPGLHLERQTATAREAFREADREAGCDRESGRAAEIAALPVVEWKGRRLHTLRCHGETGRGPHDVNVPESLLWSLISLRRYRCPYHQ